MRSFIQRHLDPADRLGEILFGLIMALGFTAACHLELEEPDNRALFIGIFGCNLVHPQCLRCSGHDDPSDPAV